MESMGNISRDLNSSSTTSPFLIQQKQCSPTHHHQNGILWVTMMLCANWFYASRSKILKVCFLMLLLTSRGYYRAILPPVEFLHNSWSCEQICFIAEPSVRWCWKVCLWECRLNAPNQIRSWINMNEDIDNGNLWWMKPPAHHVQPPACHFLDNRQQSKLCLQESLRSIVM